MAKKKKEENCFLDIAKETGGTTLNLAGSVPYFIDTGNLSLNFICSGKFFGGGVPGGRITECYGPPATSKSLLGYACLASCQRMDGIAVLLDCERAGNADFASAAGHVNPETLITYEPISIQQVQKKIIAATKAIRAHYGVEKPILFVWDSIGVTPTEREWKTVDLPENATKAQIKAAGLERPGERARASGDLLRTINPFLNEQNATLFIINQIRKNVGVMYGPKHVGAGGGEALKFYTSCRIETAIGKVIESKTGMPLGVNLRMANKKSRCFTPGIKTEGIQLFFSEGISPLGGLLSVLMQAERIEIEDKKAGTYRVKEPWANGAEVIFEANKERNDIPLEPVFACPTLLDFKNEDEAREYFSLYQGAVELATGNAIVEKPPEDEDSFISELTADDTEEEED